MSDNELKLILEYPTASQHPFPSPQSPFSISRPPIDFDKCKKRLAFQMLQTGKSRSFSWIARCGRIHFTA
jgi:hypothetical protein